MKSSASRLALVAATALAACGGEPIAPATISVAPPPGPPPAPPTPAYGGWVESEALVAGELPSGTLVLRGGKRWLITAKTMTEARDPTRLEQALVVPTKRGPVLVGADRYLVLRFDDPLGAPTRIHQATDPVRRLGSVPGLVQIVLDDVDTVTDPKADLYLDVWTGQRGDPGGFSPLPARSIVFLDAQRGAAFFGPPARFFKTTDGGARWLPLESEPIAEGTVTSNGRGVQFGGEHPSTPPADPFADATVAPEPPLLTWLRTTQVEPLYIAARSGVPAAPGQAFIAGNGLLARVDLADGNILELGQTPLRHCSLAGSVAGPIAACGDRKERTAHVIRENPLRLEGSTKIGHGELVSVPSGGVAVTSACDDDNAKRGFLCIRQPDGAWASIKATVPRADGTGLAVATVDHRDQIDVVDLAGTRRTLARAPERFAIRTVSEDESGAVWVLAQESAPPSPDGARRAPDVWQLGKVVDGQLQWKALEEARRVALRGAMTLAMGNRIARVRSRPDRPAQSIELGPGLGEQPEIHPLGFEIDRRTHLGFVERGLRDKPVEGNLPVMGSMDGMSCETKAPPRPFADRGMAGDKSGFASVRMGTTGMVAWKRAGSGIDVRFLDVFAPGTGVQEARFALPSAWQKGRIDVPAAAVGNGRVAMFVHGPSLQLLRSGAPPTELAEESGDEPLETWLGDDGALLARRGQPSLPLLDHWPPGGTTRTRVATGAFAGVGGVDATGFTLFEANGSTGARVRIKASPDQPRTLSLGDFRRDDAFVGLATLPRARCTKGATGERFRTESRFATFEVGRDRSLSGHLLVELVVDQGKACVARAAGRTEVDDTDTVIRVDFVAGKADAIALSTKWTSRDLVCRIDR